MKLYTPKHEVLIIDDGSIDGSFELLSNCPFIKLERIKQNCGKGTAIQMGLENAAFDKVIIFDGDMELDPAEISKLMILDNNSGLVCVFGSRYENIKPFASLWGFGNFFFTGLFNMVYGSDHSDALCCAKAFFKGDLNLKNISAVGFDIDVELAANLTKNSFEIHFPIAFTMIMKLLKIMPNWLYFLLIKKGMKTCLLYTSPSPRDRG